MRRIKNVVLAGALLLAAGCSGHLTTHSSLPGPDAAPGGEPAVTTVAPDFLSVDNIVDQPDDLSHVTPPPAPVGYQVTSYSQPARLTAGQREITITGAARRTTIGLHRAPLGSTLLLMHVEFGAKRLPPEEHPILPGFAAEDINASGNPYQPGDTEISITAGAQPETITKSFTAVDSVYGVADRTIEQEDLVIAIPAEATPTLTFTTPITGQLYSTDTALQAEVSTADANTKPAEEALNTITGAVTSNISTVAARSAPTSGGVQNGGFTQTLTAPFTVQAGAGGPILQRPEITTITGTIEGASLDDFDDVQGWAPPGQAWLHFHSDIGFTSFSNGRVFLTAAGCKAATVTLDDDDNQVNCTLGSGLTFLVPDTTLRATLTYQEAGTESQHNFFNDQTVATTLTPGAVKATVTFDGSPDASPSPVPSPTA